VLRSLVVAGASFLIAAPAQAVEWTSIGGPESGATWYMDGARITMENGRVHAWVKVDASRDPTVKYRSAMMLYSALCESQQLKVLSVTQYDSYGKIIYSDNQADSSYATYGYNPVVPESMGETVLRVACAVANNK